MAKEKELEITYYRFLSEVRSFLSKLVKDPIHCDISKYLKNRDVTKKKLVNELISVDILERHEKILDRTNSDEKTAKYVVKYKVKKKDFEDKVRKVYKKFFMAEKSNVNESVDEIPHDEINRYNLKGNKAFSFGKNGNGLSDEFLELGNIIYSLSKDNNVYLRDSNIDTLDDVYDLSFDVVPKENRNKSVFKDEENMKQEILKNHADREVYSKRGGMKINEDGEGCGMTGGADAGSAEPGGATATSTVGAIGDYTVPFGMLRRKIYNECSSKKHRRVFITEKQLKMLQEDEGVTATNTVGSIGNYTANGLVLKTSDGKEDPCAKAGKIDVKMVMTEISNSDIKKQADETDRHPSEKQIKAGNYKHGHVRINGFDISIENPKGSKRSGTDANGKHWEVVMKNHYGYFRGTDGEGKDGDAVDVFIGPNTQSSNTIYVVDQRNNKGEFDESKVMLGFSSEKEAKDAYLSNYENGVGKRLLMKITGVSIPFFKKWLFDGKRQRKPFYDYYDVKKK